MIKKILLSNLYGLVSIPLLCIAFLFDLIEKLIKKVPVIVIGVILYLASQLVFHLLRHPDQLPSIVQHAFMMWLFIVLVCVLSLGFAYIVPKLLMGILAILFTVFQSISQALTQFYGTVYGHAEHQFSAISDERTAVNYAFCPFYTLAFIFNKLLTIITKYASYLLYVAMVLVVVVPIGYEIYQVYQIFGTNLLTYLSLYSMVDLAYGFITYFIVLGVLAALFMLLAEDFKQWSEQISHESIVSTKNYFENYFIGEGKTVDHGLIQIALEHFNSIESFQEDIKRVLSKEDDYILLSDYDDYMSICQNISQHIENEQYILTNLENDVERLMDLKNKITQRMCQIESESERLESSGFFEGCTTLESLKSRYKNLCKIYHPDTGAGDEETFKRINTEYETLRQELS